MKEVFMEFGYTEEQLMFRDSVYKYAKKEIVPLVEEADLKSEFSMEVWRKLGEMGLLGLPFPEELGGSGASVVTCCLSTEALGHAGVDQGHLLALGAHTYLCTDTIYKHGTPDQLKKYVPKLASGEWIGCMGQSRKVTSGFSTVRRHSLPTRRYATSVSCMPRLIKR
jgi:alkylation response protein AidB-like acyl-CoA dehydrogenase